MTAPLTAWRCFPWSPDAGHDQPFSSSYIPPGQRTGRFDLADQPRILYLSDDPAHVVAEALQSFRNLPFAPGMLRKHGYPLAIAEVRLENALVARLADLCDPAWLVRLGISPDLTAHHDRTVTQALSRRIYEAESSYTGLRWWSTISGAWHTIALFADRVRDGGVMFGVPRELGVGAGEVGGAREMLNLR